MFDTNARMQLQPIRTQADFHDRRFARDRSDDEALIRRSGSIQYPLESFALLIFFVHPHFGMQKYFHSSNKPLLPIMSKDNCDAVDLSLMAFHKGSVMLKGGHILPTL
jgi:hypothetical protein